MSIERYAKFITKQNIVESFSSFLGHMTGAIPSQTPTHVDDKFFNHPSTKTVSKVAAPVKYHIADTDGTVQTKEGPIGYKAGYHVIDRGNGDTYAMPPSEFSKYYDDHGGGSATPKAIMKKARSAVGHGSVNTSWGAKLPFKQGEDMIVQHGTNDYGVVKNDIFAKTYKVHD